MKLIKEARYLSEKDPILATVIRKSPFLEISKSSNFFVSLVESIISQQLSVKASDTIYRRFESVFPQNKITPEELLSLPDGIIRETGISYRKITYMKDLAKKVCESDIVFEKFEIMTDEEIIDELTKVKGIGRWTGEMFLIFAMGRPNVFSYGDLGLKNAVKKLYGFNDLARSSEFKETEERWKPYRSLASRYLWKSLDL